LDAQVGLTATWRSYCARPGVSSCQAYDALSQGSQPAGPTFNFLPNVPYLGFWLHAELFPLARLDNWAQGFGISGSFGEGFSLTQISQSNSLGTLPSQSARATDTEYQANLLWRWFYLWGVGGSELGYLGVRGGIGGKSFDVDPNAHVPLPSSDRFFPLVALDASLPVTSWLKVDASALYLINPHPSANDAVNFGASTSSLGYGLEAGLSGELRKWFGYTLHLRYVSFTDHFSGQGVQWQSGGVAQESYAQAVFSAAGRF
jgi:hypothetical protein